MPTSGFEGGVLSLELRAASHFRLETRRAWRGATMVATIRVVPDRLALEEIAVVVRRWARKHLELRASVEVQGSFIRSVDVTVRLQTRDGHAQLLRAAMEIGELLLRRPC